jgi:small subunit ribosomal protein S5
MAYNNQRTNTDGQSRGEFIEQIVKISRVSKKTKGGNKVGFSALAVVGDGKGKVGVGLGKAPDVSSAVRKGIAIAKKHMVAVPLIEGTIPTRVDVKVGAARVMLKPAPRGSGIIAGGAVRSVVAAAGITNISSKVLGSNNQAGNVNATLEALRQLSLMHEKKGALSAKTA